MKKLIGIATILSAVFYAASVMAVEPGKIVIERSPFGNARMMLMRNADNGSSNPEYQGEKDAEAENTSNSELVIFFDKIIKDKELLNYADGALLPKTSAPWAQIQIQVDPLAKGMTVSYKRRVSSIAMENIVVYVPTQTDKQIWLDEPYLFYQRYAEAFNRKRYWLLQTIRKPNVALSNDELDLEILQNGPILVYPSR